MGLWIINIPKGEISTVDPAIATTDAADGLIFSRAAVTNSLLSKFGQGTHNVDAEPFKKRLFSISH